MQLSFLRPLYEQPPGLWCTAYLDASRDSENARHEIALRWRAAREELAGQGADAATLSAMDAAVADHEPLVGQAGLAVFGTAGRVPMTMPLAEPPAVPVAKVGALPHAMPLVAGRGEQVSWLQVVVDRTGADLAGAVEGAAHRPGMMHREIVGRHDWPVHKAKPGGWSAAHHERAVENTWDRNAGGVAHEVAMLADAAGADVIVVGGDPQSRPLLVEHLPARWRDKVVVTDVGSRAPGADPEPIAEATVLAVAEQAEQIVRSTLDRYASALGRDAEAGVGLAATVAALRRNQVDTEIMAYGATPDAQLWIGPAPTDVALTADELKATGVKQTYQARADDAILRALTGSDANLVMVDPGATILDGGLGTLLRYVDPSTVKGTTDRGNSDQITPK